MRVLILRRVFCSLLLTLGIPSIVYGESYGPLFHSNANEEVSVFRYGGQIHWMAFFDRADLSNKVASAFYVNLTTGESISFPTTCAGRFNGYNKSVIGSKLYAASADPDHLCEFDLLTKKWTDRGRYGVLPADKGSYSRVGSDNRLYLGVAVRGTLERWDPVRLAFDHYGVIDPTVWKIGKGNSAINLLDVTVANGIATAHTASAHHMPVAAKVKVSSTSIPALNGIFSTTTNPTIDSFTFAVTAVSNGTYQDPSLSIRNIECIGCYRYVYTFAISPDARHVYMAMRDAYENRWWLVIRSTDPANTEEQVCWEDNNFSIVEVAYGLNGKLYARRTGANYELTDGTCPSIPLTAPITYRPYEYYQDTLNSRDPTLVKTYFNFEVNYDDLYADSSNSGSPKLRYRPVGSDSWIEKTGSVSLWPDTIKRMTALDSEHILLVSGSYGPNASFDVKTKLTNIIGRIGTQSSYAAAISAPYLLLSGYPTVSYRADSRVPWNWSAGNNTMCSASVPSNPCMAVQAWGKYHYYPSSGRDGLFYVASAYDRQGGVGGEIGWYNPLTNERGSYRVGPPSIQCFRPHDFIPLTSPSQGQTEKFAYSGGIQGGGADNCAETQGRLFIFDSASKSITADFPMLPGAKTAGKLIDNRDGTIIGVLREFPMAGKYTVYKMRIGTGEVLWKKDFTGSVNPEYKAVRGIDGFIYFPLKRSIVKLNPSDGVSITGSDSLPITSPEITQLLFMGRDLWFSSGADLNVMRNISGEAGTPSAPSKLRIAGGS